jgi:hypothetical protein
MNGGANEDPQNEDAHENADREALYHADVQQIAPGAHTSLSPGDLSPRLAHALCSYCENIADA